MKDHPDLLVVFSDTTFLRRYQFAFVDRLPLSTSTHVIFFSPFTGVCTGVCTGVFFTGVVGFLSTGVAGAGGFFSTTPFFSAPVDFSVGGLFSAGEPISERSLAFRSAGVPVVSAPMHLRTVKTSASGHVP